MRLPCYDGLSGGINLSYKTEKINAYSAFDFQERNLPKYKDKLKSDLKDGAVSAIEENREVEDRDFINRSIRTGLDYYLRPKTKLTAEYTYGYQLEDKTKENFVTKYGGDWSFKSATNEQKTEYKPNDYHQVMALLDHSFANKMRLNTGFSYLTAIQKKTEEKKVYSLDENGNWLNAQPSLENKTEDQDKDELNWNLGFSNLKLGSHHLKFGYAGKRESSDFYVNTDKFNYTTLTWASTSSDKDNFDVSETTQALYLTDEFTHQFLRVRAGLRYERTNLKSNTASIDFDGKGNYDLFLPNLNLSANIDETQYLTFNIGRRIRRPGLKDLNPYEEEKDASSVKKGNPDLMPERAWAYELGYLKNFEHFNIGANLFYRDIHDVIQKTLSEDDQGIVTEQPDNTGRARTSGIELLSTIRPFKFWELNASYSVFESKILSGDYEGDALSDQYKWSAKAINDFKLPFGIKMQVAANVVGPKSSGTKEENTVWFIDLGLEKEILKNGFLSFRIADLFDSLEKVKTEYTDKSTTTETESTVGRLFLAGVKFRF